MCEKKKATAAVQHFLRADEEAGGLPNGRVISAQNGHTNTKHSDLVCIISYIHTYIINKLYHTYDMYDIIYGTG